MKRRGHLRQKFGAACTCAAVSLSLLLAAFWYHDCSTSCSCSFCWAFVFLPLTQRTTFPAIIRRRVLGRSGTSTTAVGAAAIKANDTEKPQPPLLLIPQDNPYANVTAVSSVSGVRFSSVRNGLHRLYPPHELSLRNAASRTDGYWPYIQKGQDPPQHLTYGEFDFYFFADLLDRAHSYYYHYHHHNQGGGKQPQNDEPSSSSSSSDWTDKVFVDIGSGTGRLVLAASALHPTWRACRGIELLPTIHDAAQATLEKCQRRQSAAAKVVSTFALDCSNSRDPAPVNEGCSSRSNSSSIQQQQPDDDDDGFIVLLPMAPIEFVCGSFEDPYIYIGDADCIFVFSTCLGEGLRSSLARAIGRQCKPGTIVITTDYTLPLEGTVPPVENGDDRIPSGSFKLKLVEKKDGYCWLTNGASTAYIHQVVESLWQHGPQQPLERPVPSIEDVVFETVVALESGQLTDTDAFLRGVSNNIIFHGLPDTFLPET